MKHIKLLLILFTTMNLSCGYAQQKPFEKKITQLLESIYVNDSISDSHFFKNTGSGETKELELKKYFHCFLRKEGNLIHVDVSLVTKPSDSFCYSLNIKGIESFVFIKDCNFDQKQLDVFFQLDIDSWRFIIEKIGDDFGFYELKRYPNIHHKMEESDDDFKF